jgi:alpha-maltose-1-phosphate synthase
VGQIKVNQAVFGVFHHFELGRELMQRGLLGTIYSTFPWARLKREGLPHNKVETFPWIHAPEILLWRAGMPSWLSDQTDYLNVLLFDEWMARRIGDCDAFIAISGAGLKTGGLVQKRGGKFVCDRGSTHQRYQERLVNEEHQRWGVNIQVSDPRDTIREEKIYDAADAITVPSSFAQRSFIESGVPANKIHMIPYGVNLSNFAKVSDPTVNTYEVLFVGAVALRKGVPYLLEAFSRIKHPAKRLRLIGAISPCIKRVLYRLPQDNVEFLGPIPQADLAGIMSSSHLLVLPSIEDGFGLVLSQALACGCPVLASTNTGGPDLFTDGVEGFVVPIRDPGALTERMQQLADDPEMQRRMSEAGLRRAKDLGGWTEYGSSWERLLRGLATSSGEPADDSGGLGSFERFG